ncbi:MAG TPA: c-type cytochrome domain-containing protein [Kofleriaceae bacterium]|nr:c-type cytochrome domain-containing protein [Kofleriaceae bacterium]
MRRLLFVGLLAGCLDGGGCSTEPPPECLAVAPDTACLPQYPPTFTNVYKNTLQPNCGYMDGSCHSASGRAGGLSFQDQDTAYAGLLNGIRVKPMNPTCSEMIVRATSPGKDYQMPPGDALSEPEQCALVQWVQMGAMP